MINLFDVTELLPNIICGSLVLNIIGNTIKLTFNVRGRYIIWMLFVISIATYFMFCGFNIKSFFIAVITFSFSVSSYDLIKYSSMIIRRK